MVGLRHNFIFSAVLHTAVIIVLFIFCRGMEDRAPANFMFVSLLEETAGDESGSFFIPRVQQRIRDSTLQEISSQNLSIERDKNTFRQKDEKDDVSGSKQGSLTVPLNHEAGVTEVRGWTHVDTHAAYTGTERKRESSGKSQANDFYSLIRTAIERVKIYPLLARKRKIEGTAVTSFSIDDRGYPGNLKIRKSSGYEILDSAALKIIAKAAPFPKVDGEIIVPITFKLTESISSH
jgi:TonB family protein